MKQEYSKEYLIIVDDEIEVGQVVTELLSSLGFNADSESSGKNALQQIRNGKYTFLITDINMPELNGIELIKKVKEEKPDISIIAMTGFDKDYAYMDVINAGANDFITKPFKIDEIEAKISRVLIEKRIRDELAKLSITDNLTGLFNQRHFHNKLKDSNIRGNVDTAFRYGGDEFAIILVEADKEIVINTSERLKKGFRESDGVTASIGFATYQKEMDVNDLIALTDKDLYKSKSRNNS
jgi:PleD family two-component response regulator